MRTLGPGQRFTPQDVANPSDRFAQQVLLSIRHIAHDQTYEAAATSRPSYDNSFTAMPATTPATPHRTIPRPRIVGSQIALIAGPDGEEIYTEPYGRVKVWFPWDREAQRDGSDTPWIRVGQPWAGTTWGHQVIPRIGMEAVVSYQEGDPDRPFITALLPDPTNPVPRTDRLYASSATPRLKERLIRLHMVAMPRSRSRPLLMEASSRLATPSTFRFRLLW